MLAQTDTDSVDKVWRLRLEALPLWFREHRSLILVLLVFGLIALPKWWTFDATAFSVATNVFATILVVPVLVFGVERALQRVEHQRNMPKARAMRTALDLPVLRMLNFGLAGGESGLPGLTVARNKGIANAKTIDETVAMMNDGTATFLLENPDSLRAFIKRRDWAMTADAISKMLAEAKSLQDMLWLAQSIVDAKTFATAFGVHDQVIELDMARYMTSDEVGKINDTFVPEVRGASLDRLANLLLTLSTLHLSLIKPD